MRTRFAFVHGCSLSGSLTHTPHSRIHTRLIGTRYVLVLCRLRSDARVRRNDGTESFDAKLKAIVSVNLK